MGGWITQPHLAQIRLWVRKLGQSGHTSYKQITPTRESTNMAAVTTCWASAFTHKWRNSFYTDCFQMWIATLFDLWKHFVEAMTAHWRDTGGCTMRRCSDAFTTHNKNVPVEYQGPNNNISYSEVCTPDKWAQAPSLLHGLKLVTTPSLSCPCSNKWWRGLINGMLSS